MAALRTTATAKKHQKFKKCHLTLVLKDKGEFVGPKRESKQLVKGRRNGWGEEAETEVFGVLQVVWCDAGAGWEMSMRS